VKLRFGQLISHNLTINGLKAILFSVGLGKSEFVEFSYAVSLIERERAGLMLDVGCGHSLLSSLAGGEVIVLDLDKDSVRWQLKISQKKNHGIRASATNLPFRDETFQIVTAISSIEHIPLNGDVLATAEILRTMRAGGLCIISVPGLPLEGSPIKIKRGLMIGIPKWAQVFLRGSLLRAIFTIFHVDRTDTYFERIYSPEDVRARLIPNGCTEAQANAYSLPRPLKNIVNKIYPYGFSTPIDMILASKLRFVGDMLASTNCQGGLVTISFRRSSPEGHLSATKTVTQ
jgi:SAM-dependent methyltransferase